MIMVIPAAVIDRSSIKKIQDPWYLKSLIKTKSLDFLLQNLQIFVADNFLKNCPVGVENKDGGG